MREIIDDLAGNIVIEEEVEDIYSRVSRWWTTRYPIEDVVVTLKAHEQVSKSLPARFMMLLKDIRRIKGKNMLQRKIFHAGWKHLL